MRRLTAYRGHSHHFYFTNLGWYDGGRRLLISSDREDRNLNLATGLVFKLTGRYDHFGVSRLYKQGQTGHTPFGRQGPLIGFGRIVFGHGQLVGTDGRAILKEAYSFLRP